MSAKFKLFKCNEITSFFEHAKSMGMQPTLIIKMHKIDNLELGWIKVQIGHVELISKTYETKWLKSRVKSYIEFNKKCPYGEVKVIE